MDTASPSLSSNKGTTLAAFMAEQTATRLRKLAYELRHTRQSMDVERVHDLRVAVRRLMETLRVGKGVFPADGVEEVLDDLRKIMKAAGEVRSCDIAADLLQVASVPEDADVFTRLTETRRAAEDKLFERAQHAYHRDATRRWRAALMLRPGSPLTRNR